MTPSDATTRENELLSAVEIAARIGAGQSTVSNWRSREQSFPSPVETSTGDRFIESEVATWLDERPIRTPQLGPDEPKGTTYGDRFRRQITPAPEGSEWSAAEFEKHLWNAMHALRGDYRPAEAALVVLALLWARHQTPDDRSVAESEPPASPEEIASIALPVDNVSTIPLIPPHLIRSVNDRTWSQCVEAVSSMTIPGPTQRPALVEILVEKIGDAVSPAEHTTPPGVARLMERLIDPPDGARVHDPFCRAGELLLAVTHHAAARRRSVLVSGATISDDARRVPALLAALAGAEVDLRRAPLLAPESRKDIDQYDVVLTNPPFNMRAGQEKLDNDPRWRFGVPPPHKLNFAWLQSVLSSLRPGGRAAVITANNATFSRSPLEQRIRHAMVAAGTVECVIALPDRLFAPYASISTSLWLLRAPDTHPASEMLFIDATDLGTIHRRNRRALGDDDVKRIVDEYRRWSFSSTGSNDGVTSGFASRCSIGDAATGDVDLNPRARIVKPRGPTDRVASEHRAQDLHHRLRLDRASAQERQTHTDAAVEALKGRPSTRWMADVSLGSVADLLAGPGTVATTALEPGTTPLVTPRSITHKLVSDEPDIAVTRKVADTMQRYELRSGDIIGIRSGNVGRFGLLRMPLNQRLLLGPGCLRIRPNGDDVDPAFLAALLGTAETQDWIMRRAVGSALSSISMTTLKALPLRLPPPEEQRRIGALLCSVDEESVAHEKAAKAGAELAVALAEALTSPANDTD